MKDDKTYEEGFPANNRPTAPADMINLADIKNSDKKFDNRYRLIEKIGGGGFSEVWLAHDINASIDVALKIYTPNSDLDEEGKEDFKREFSRLCGLNHSHIIHAIGFGIHDDELPYLALSVCKNGSAKKLIGHYDEEELWRFIEEVAMGLHYLHSHDITHQDIKPDNILINSDGQYLIIDFGISTKTRNTLRRTDKGAIGGGTPWYMSAESYTPESSDIHARDIWAFGATLYEIITGDVPFGQYGGLTQQAQKGKIPEIGNDVSDEMKQLVYDCLALESWNRPAADQILERVQLHKSGKRPKKYGLWRIVGWGMAAMVAVICGVSIFNMSTKESSADENVVAVNKNDSVYIDQLKLAILKADPEIVKTDLSAVDEAILCSAAEIFMEISRLEVTDSVKRLGEQMWASCQDKIDLTYEFLHDKGMYYRDLQAESASREFDRRSSLMADYVTPSRIRTRLYAPQKTTGSARTRINDSRKETDSQPEASATDVQTLSEITPSGDITRIENP